MTKHFIVNPKANPLSKEAIEQIAADKAEVYLKGAINQKEKNEQAIDVSNDHLKHAPGRVVIKCDTNYKENETLSSGLVLGRPRDWNQFDMKIKNPTQAIVISAEYIPKGAIVLIGHTTIHDTNRIFNYKEVSGSDVNYYSIPENQVFLWRMGNEEWKTIFPFETALKIWKPYKGFLVAVEPTFLKDTLFVTSGELKWKAVKTVKSSDYVVTYREPSTGKERKLLRFRPFGNEKEHREPEAIGEAEDITQAILNDEYLIGIELSDAKKCSEYLGWATTHSIKIDNAFPNHYTHLNG